MIFSILFDTQIMFDIDDGLRSVGVGADDVLHHRLSRLDQDKLGGKELSLDAPSRG